MSTKPPTPICRTAPMFVEAHLGKGILAPLTGQDFRALEAFVHLVDLYAACDTAGREHAITAMRAVVQAAQPACWPVLRKAIAKVLDFTDEEPMWQRITG